MDNDAYDPEALDNGYSATTPTWNDYIDSPVYNPHATELGGPGDALAAMYGSHVDNPYISTPAAPAAAPVNTVDPSLVPLRTRKPAKRASDERSKLAIMLANIQRHTGELLTCPSFLQAESKAAYPSHWPHACWHCTLRFDTRPIGMPIRITKTKEYHLHGFFCSSNCVLGYAKMRGTTERVQPLLSRLLCVWPVDKGDKRGPRLDQLALRPAPPPQVMDSFGGPMSAMQYKQQYCRDTRTIAIPQEYMMVPFGFNLFKMPSQTHHGTLESCQSHTKQENPRKATKTARTKRKAASVPRTQTRCPRRLAKSAKQHEKLLVTRPSGPSSHVTIRAMMNITSNADA
jgi:hypothetical protein